MRGRCRGRECERKGGGDGESQRKGDGKKERVWWGGEGRGRGEAVISSKPACQADI